MRDAVVEAFGPPGHWTAEQGRASWREPSDGAGWSRAIVLFEARGVRRQPVAVASCFHPRLHAGREWCHVEVAPVDIGRGYGRAALAALRSCLPATASSLRGKVQAGSPGLRFAERHGFIPVQRTRTLRVVLDKPDVGGGVRVHAIPTEFADDSTVRTWRDFYVAGHDWDPPGYLSVGLSRELFFSTGGQVLIAARAGRAVGIALLTGAAAPAFTGGAVDRHDPEAVGIATALLAAAAGGTPDGTVDAEVDDWLWEVDRALQPWRPTVVDEAFVVAEDHA